MDWVNRQQDRATSGDDTGGVPQAATARSYVPSLDRSTNPGTRASGPSRPTPAMPPSAVPSVSASAGRTTTGGLRPVTRTGANHRPGWADAPGAALAVAGQTSGPSRVAPGPTPLAAYRAALRDVRRAAAAAFGFSAILNVLMLTGSLYMLQVYDRVLASGSVETLLALFAIVVLLYAFHAFFDALRARLLARAALRLDRRVGAQAFALGLSRDGQGTTALRDLDTVRGTLGGPALHALFDAPWMPLFFGILFLVHPWLGWVTVGGAAVAVALALANHLLTRHRTRSAVQRETRERDLADRAIRSRDSVLGMGMQAALTARWQARRDATLAAQTAAGAPSDVLAGLSRAVRMLLQSAILTVGAWLVIRGEMSGGLIIAASILSGRALAPIDQLTGHWRTLQRGWIAHRALGAAFAAAPSTASAAFDLPDPVGRLDVTGLTVLAPSTTPQGERRSILGGIDLSLVPGQGLGIVGASGSGKSTLARAILGLVPVEAGDVRLDGATLDQWEPSRLGRHIGYLPQMPEPLSGTVRDLIARFDPATTDATVIEAARRVGLHDFILALPQGYATEIGGESGLRLSGGQMQRLALARAVCGAPRLIVLDEPNAHLDHLGEEALGRAIAELRAQGSTVIVVTHRPQVLAALDRVMVLDAGRILREGPREEVLAAARAAGPERVTPLRPDPSRPDPSLRVAANGPAVLLTRRPGGPSRDHGLADGLADGIVDGAPMPRAVAAGFSGLQARRAAQSRQAGGAA